MSGKGRTLLVINFVVDANHPVLGFATRWLEVLRPHVDRMVVLTGQVGEVPATLDADIVSTNWVPGQNVRNVLRFERALARTLRNRRPDAVFTHMAAPQSLLAAPLLRARRIRHVLWYTHLHTSPTVRAASRLVNVVVTAVPETCVLSGGRAVAIGHGIDVERFPLAPRRQADLVFVHWGRTDPIKRLDYLANVVAEASQAIGEEIRFRVIGSPSTSRAEAWWGEVVDEDRMRKRPVIEWIPGVSQSRLPDVTTDATAFIHACAGFDKSPLEAAALGLPVLSEVSHIMRETGIQVEALSLRKQLLAFLALDDAGRRERADLQRTAVLERHALQTLPSRLLPILGMTARD